MARSEEDRVDPSSGKSAASPSTPGRAPKLMFSGLDSSVATEIEAAFANAGHVVVSNSRNYRMFDTVPLMIPIPAAAAGRLRMPSARRAASL